MTSRRSMSTLAVLGLLTVAAAAQGGAAAAPGTTEPAPTPTESGGTETSAATAEAPAGDPIIIGALTSLTGPFTPWGVQVRDGMQLAVDELNAAGGVAGRPLELRVVDDESNPEAGSQRHRAADRGGRRRRRRDHLQRRRPRHDSRRRGAGDAAVPGQGRIRGDPHPGQPLHVPHVHPVGTDGRRSDRPVRRRSRASPRSERSSPTTPGGRRSAPRWRTRSPTSRVSSCRSRWRRCPSRTSRRTCATSKSSSPTSSWPPDTRRVPGRSPCSRPISASTSR